MAAKSRRTANINVREFENFFQGWLVRQEHYLEELRSALRICDESRDEDLCDLIARVLEHYQQYYEEKSRIANYDVSLVFSPPWFSPFEQSFFWIAGFKPGLAFRILAASVDDMSKEQSERMETLKVEMKTEERELENELARIQESVAAPPIVEVARKDNLPVDGEYDTADMESVMETLKSEMEVVLANADMLRSRTAERLVEILTPVQNVRFLTAVTELQLKIRMWGSQMDADRRRR
ncbi:protein DOG1-like 4 [Cynara cardunculus var. scolymus]|uniref:DOG1 domain-containing protein n=1 Tax=Cynara cardunculus var. scolymus TaxID=59895 RepID=A0A103XQ13_CYNCS|nr:protein DOG1-like 4 [Cynara cardunculus var. scolymus]XP_024980739.1 protein DOG1-like 4 [Cynara cardunculus var. scolymus]XP_024980740.1 protein DOG1-like 4 [Cynara cardunculus var. scolymus]KVH94804.1 DOG1 domain-containing protein [Cynara cardunculus var. scolymus]